jgi:hippurate hydrolase
VSRNAPPGTPSVLSIGKVVADGATNIIPESVRMEGTLRAMDEEWRFRAHELIKRVSRETAAAMGACVDVVVRVGFPHLHNDPEESAFVRSQAVNFVGADMVEDLDLWFAGEDFAYYLQEVPGTFYRIGTGNEEKHTTFGLHHPKFNLDENALQTSMGFMAYLALQRGRQS